MGPIRCPATSVEDYHSTFRNIPEERGSRQLRGGSLKSQLQSAQAPSVNFKTVVVLTPGTASVSPSPLGQLQNRRGPHLRLSFSQPKSPRSASKPSWSSPQAQLQSAQVPSVSFKTVVVLTSGTAFFKGALLRNFNKTFVPEPLITRVKQLEDIFSIVRTNFRT
jgi:hypothetical protein